MRRREAVAEAARFAAVVAFALIVLGIVGLNLLSLAVTQ